MRDGTKPATVPALTRDLVVIPKSDQAYRKHLHSVNFGFSFVKTCGITFTNFGVFPMKQSCLPLSAAFALAFGLGVSLHAATISVGTGIAVANGGQAPGSSLNYDFGDFGNNGQPINLTSFTVSTVGASQYAGVGQPIPYTTLIAPGGTSAFTTGIAYDNNHDGTTALIATFRSLTASDFIVYILDGNTDGNYVGNFAVGLGVNGGPNVSTATIFDGANEFTKYSVTGAASTDVFDVYATTNAGYAPSIGGLTFSTSVTPEPSSLVLLGTGILAIGGLARRKLLKA